MAIQFVDLPINSMVISHSVLYVCQAEYILKISHIIPDPVRKE